MSIHAVTYYEISCDEPGCTTDLWALTGELMAMKDRSGALDIWRDADGVHLDDGRTYCIRHDPTCFVSGCDDGRTCSCCAECEQRHCECEDRS